MSVLQRRATSSVAAEGHPDKVADQISDCIVDYLIAKDPDVRTAIEVLVTTNNVIIAGEVSGLNELKSGRLDGIENAVRDCIRDIGYEQDGFNWRTIQVTNYLHNQSNIVSFPDRSSEFGAGDTVTVYGYACIENPSLMPTSLYFANQILRAIAEARRSGRLPQIGPDGKCQLTVEYIDEVPVRVSHLVLSCQHLVEDMTSDEIRSQLLPIVSEVLPSGWIDSETEVWVNQTGKFIVGGPDGDAGVTGRKVSSDSYGDAAPQGDTAFSGKDPSKLDRSGSYMARYLAKNIVASGLCNKCLVSLSYGIGLSKPILVQVDDFGSGSIDPRSIAILASELVDLSPNGIINHLDLRKPIYRRASCFGHFGREPEADGGFSWERTDLASKFSSHSLPTKRRAREEFLPPSENEVKCFMTFEDHSERAGFALVDFLQECLGTLFQYSEFGTKTQRLGARSISFTVSGYNPELSSELRDFTREYIRWQAQPVGLPQVSDEEIANEIVSFRRVAEQFALLSEKMERQMDETNAILTQNTSQLEEVSASISAGFEGALAHFDNNLLALESRMKSHIGDELGETMANITALLKKASQDESYSQDDITRLQTELRELEEQKPGMVAKVRDVVLSGAVGGTAGNLLTDVLRALGQWPF